MLTLAPAPASLLIARCVLSPDLPLVFAGICSLVCWFVCWFVCSLVGPHDLIVARRGGHYGTGCPTGCRIGTGLATRLAAELVRTAGSWAPSSSPLVSSPRATAARLALASHGSLGFRVSHGSHGSRDLNRRDPYLAEQQFQNSLEKPVQERPGGNSGPSNGEVPSRLPPKSPLEEP